MQLQTGLAFQDGKQQSPQMHRTVDAESPSPVHAKSSQAARFSHCKGTWTVKRPTHTVKVIRGAFVYKIKELEDGTIEKFKARYCAKGYSQIPGVHYRERFAPVASATAIRAILLSALEYNWSIHHVDISTAFLNAKIEDGIEIYLQPPPNIHLKPGEYLRLRRGLYGLVQGSALWSQLLSRTLLKLGFKRSAADASVFTRTNNHGTVLLGAVVDDFAITGDSQAAINQVKSEIACIWDCTDFGALKWYIQLSVLRDRTKKQMTISQGAYIEKLLHRYTTLDPETPYKPYDTPMSTAAVDRLSLLMCPNNPADRDYMLKREYRGLLGSLQHCRHTRPDILQSLSECAKFQTNPGPRH